MTMLSTIQLNVVSNAQVLMEDIILITSICTFIKLITISPIDVSIVTLAPDQGPPLHLLHALI
jgi:hypothetical protein